MRNAVATALIVVLSVACTGPAAPAAAPASLRPASHHGGGLERRVSAEVLSSTSTGLILKLEVSPPSGSAEGAGPPEPVLVQVPCLGAIETRVVSAEFLGPDGRATVVGAGQEEHWLRNLVDVSAPGLLRDLRVVRCSFNPVDARSGPESLLPRGTTVRSVTLEINATASTGLNERTSRPRLLSPVFDRIYRSVVLNYDPSALTEPREFSSSEEFPALSSCAGVEGRPGGASAVSASGRPLDGSRYLIIVDDSMAGLADSLLVVHGMVDDNVLVQDTIRLVQALLEEGKDFDLMLYPRADHGLTHWDETRLDLMRRTARYFREHLGEVDRPEE